MLSNTILGMKLNLPVWKLQSRLASRWTGLRLPSHCGQQPPLLLFGTIRFTRVTWVKSTNWIVKHPLIQHQVTLILTTRLVFISDKLAPKAMKKFCGQVWGISPIVHGFSKMWLLQALTNKARVKQLYPIIPLSCEVVWKLKICFWFKV